MSRITLPRSLPCVCLAALCWVGPGLTPARAQDTLPASDTDLSKFLENNTRNAFYKLINGDKQATPADAPVVDMAAKWYVYRVTVVTRQRDPKEMSKVVSQFDTELVKPALNYSPKNQKFLEMLEKDLLRCFKEVLAMDMKEHQMAVINAGLMLQPLGALGGKLEGIGDFLIGTVKKSEKNEIVQLYAFKGLHEYFLARQPKFNQFSEDTVRKPEIDRIEPLLEYLARKSPVPESASPEEVEAVRFIRREVIRALAETRVPAVPLLNGTIKAPVAYELLRVLNEGKQQVDPPASLSEKCEAAIGLCQMNTKLVPKYQPELSVALVAKFLVEFIEQYRTDQPLFSAKGGPQITLPRQPWKVQAERLRLALKEFENNVPAGAEQKQIKNLQTITDSIFADIKQHKQVEPPTLLKNLLRGMPRPNPAVYQGTPSLQIEVREWPPFQE